MANGRVCIYLPLNLVGQGGKYIQMWLEVKPSSDFKLFDVILCAVEFWQLILLALIK